MGETFLLGDPLRTVNVGIDTFAHALETHGVPVARVEWHPPLGGPLPACLWSETVETANRQAMTRLLEARPVVVDVRPAAEVIPGLTPGTVLHAGPPIAWARMAGPLRGAVIGALLYEGWATDARAAEELAGSGQIRFDSCHHRAAVGPMAGVTTPSMPVWVVENQAAGGARAFSTLNEGLGKVLRYGAYAPEVLTRLAWMRDVLGPAVGTAVRQVDGLDLSTLIAQALQMGDECHNRNRAATGLLFRALAPQIAVLDLPPSARREILRFIGTNDHFFLNLAMAAAKVALDAAHGVSSSSLVTAMARNGTEFGIRVSGLGDQWFTGPAGVPAGLFFPGYGPEDANRDIGDSAITETAGLGGFAMAAAPAIVQFVGGRPEDALRHSRRMYEITLAESQTNRIPALDFRGTPTGIDLRLVAHTRILPQINTGIAHREAGIGQIGAGLVTPPAACFEGAIRAFIRMLESTESACDQP